MRLTRRLHRLIRDTSLERIRKITVSLFGEGSPETTKILDACIYARDTHSGKKRDNGASLITHERSIFIIATLYLKIVDVDFLVAIFMHDMYEDYPGEWTLERIETLFGKHVSELVDAVTKPDREFFETERLHDDATFLKVEDAGQRAMLLKVVDRLHNMLTLWGSPEKRTKKITQTVIYVIPLAAKCGALTYELMQATAEQMRALHMRGGRDVSVG